ncbi:ABC transporter transmembrane domain-containing protein [Alphaproteobacteria bacterium]|nr:ABC transporter transmembrane domain-containing protein [Alphaproteobacteria bacterium]
MINSSTESKNNKKQAHKSFKELRILVPYIYPYRWRLAAAAVALLMISVAMLSLGRGLAFIVDEGLTGDDPGFLSRTILVTLVIALVLAIGSYFRASLVNQLGERVIGDIRAALFHHILSQSSSWFESARPGDILSRLTADTTIIQAVLGSTLSMAVRNIILLVGGLVLVILSSPKMSFVLAVLVPLIVFPLVFLARNLRQASKIAQEKIADLAVLAEESVSGIRSVQAFSQEVYIENKFQELTNQAVMAAISRARLRGLLSGLIIFLVIAGIGCLLWIGGQDLRAGTISAGELTSFVFYAFLVAASVGALSELGGELQRAIGALERISEIFAIQTEFAVPLTPVKTDPQLSSDITFENVSFYYQSRPETPVLDNINFTVKAGEHVALVGPSGAGKSTILHLLLRFYIPIEGQIKIGNTMINHMTNSQLRSHIGLVPQDAALFSQTIGYNIAFGSPNANFADIEKAATQAEAHQFISELPEGYNTLVGEKGIRLSGGQRQRIAIARCILRQPSIMLLDEATSSLDSQNEALVQKALRKIRLHRTSIVIAHRLSTVIDADRIFVMDKGKIIAQGNHEQLLAQSELYHQLAQHQLLSD